MSSFKINKINIGLNDRPYIIAEMSGNHDQSFEKAKKIVLAATSAGANALKLQTYTADTMTLPINRGEFRIEDQSSPWAGQSLHELYSKAFTPWEWHEDLIKLSKDLGMTCFSSPFDESALEFLESINVPAYKIASFENNHLPLIRLVAQTGKPMIISTGMSTIDEIEESVETARSAGCTELALLKCTSTYPADSRNSNILTIPDMRSRFGCEVGLSDHTMGIGASVAAIAHGATIIEKHLTLSRADGGVDSSFSLEPTEFKSLVIETERAWCALGEVYYGSSKGELLSKKHKRSIYISSDVSTGELFTKQNTRIIRPGLGLEPKHYEAILGKRASRNISAGTPLNWDLIETQ